MPHSTLPPAKIIPLRASKSEIETLREENAALRLGLVSGAEEHGVAWGLLYRDRRAAIDAEIKATGLPLEDVLDAAWCALTEFERRRYRRDVALMTAALKAWKA